MARNEGNSQEWARGGVPHQGNPQSVPPSPGDGQKEAAGGSGGCGEIAWIPLTQVLARMAEVGPLMSSREAGHIRPHHRGKDPHKDFLKGTKEALEVVARDSGSLQDPPVPRGLSSSSTSNPLHAWSSKLPRLVGSKAWAFRYVWFRCYRRPLSII